MFANLPEMEGAEVILPQTDVVSMSPVVEETNIVSLTRVIGYINGKQASVAEVQDMEKLLSSFKSNLNGFMALVVYKQMQRVARLLDAMDKIESRLYSSSSIDSRPVDELLPLFISIQSSMNECLRFLENVSNNVNVKNLMNKLDSLFNPEQIISQSDSARVSSLSKEERQKVTDVSRLLLSVIRDSKPN
jgi:hypothetical protein